jgi:hypothetical protein
MKLPKHASDYQALLLYEIRTIGPAFKPCNAWALSYL